ncbi:MAG: nuclear transport factor 2 family protein [Sphingobium sp.]
MRRKSAAAMTAAVVLLMGAPAVQAAKPVRVSQASLAEEVRQLRDKDELRELSYRFERLLDRRDWQGLAAMLTEDVDIHMIGNATVVDDGAHAGEVDKPKGFNLVGRERVLAAMARVLSDNPESVHIVTMPEIELTAPDQAKGLWQIIVYSKTDGGNDRLNFEKLENRYKKIDGKWRISSFNVAITTRVNLN